MRSNFGGLGTCSSCSFEIFPDLLAARARRVKILLRVAFDLRRPAAAGGDFVAEMAKPVCQLRLIDRRRKLLRSEETLWLYSAILTIVTFRQVEDDCVRVQ